MGLCLCDLRFFFRSLSSDCPNSRTVYGECHVNTHHHYSTGRVCTYDILNGRSGKLTFIYVFFCSMVTLNCILRCYGWFCIFWRNMIFFRHDAISATMIVASDFHAISLSNPHVALAHVHIYRCTEKVPLVSVTIMICQILMLLWCLYL